jgi:hypothetical protein
MKRISPLFLFYLLNKKNMSKVLVVSNEDGNVVQTSENNSEFGHIRVEQTRAIIDDRGWVNRKKYVALIAGKIEDLEALEYRDGQELEGKIIVKESLTPFNVKTPDRDLKYAGNSGIICLHNDSPIYRKCIYTLDITANDELIQHTNVDEIKEAYNKSVSKKLTPSQDFSL